MLLTDQRRRIGYVSPCYEGCTHDFTLLKTVFPPEQDWFKPFTIRSDLGFLGFATVYAARQVSLDIETQEYSKRGKHVLTVRTTACTAAQDKGVPDV